MKALQQLYWSFVRSKLEYGAVLWHPHYVTQKIAIERVQRKFLKYVCYKIEGTYPERGVDYNSLLEKTGFQSLEKRRMCMAISFLFNICHNIIDCPDLVQKLLFHVPRLQTRQELTFFCPRANTNILVKSPFFTMCKSYNKISNRCDLFFNSKQEILKIATEVL